ncbi:receptor-like protein EIX2 [Hibiscus syriacus]|uniref:receptor-like protein EIX2 n=1 Tax=Hibiscus syriacus TaxID=106335 RepID=UPI001921C532|nr:receptor-like protein EIX2 [Hibiscus syriacus]
MLLANWTSANPDCCKWAGVSCDNSTSHVTELHLTSSKLGGELNPALLDLKSLSVLDLSNNTFDGTQIPGWFWNLTSHLQYLNISWNHFRGNVPDLLTNHAALVLDLSSNNFTGSLPAVSLNMTALDLSDNGFSGSMSWFLCRKPMKLEVLSLGGNLLSGEIPDCWEKWGSLVAIELCHNNFSGKIPPSMGALTSLQSLHLSNNNLHGEVPESMSNCTELLTLDLSANRFSGEIPLWIGERLSNLIIIGLRWNMFHGEIPDQICGLPSLQILDLSHNNLSGEIPTCIKNLTAMITRNKSNRTISYKTSKGCFFDNIELTMKGAVFDYSTTLKLIKLVDLSDNNLTGQIPEEITTLIDLLSLNLSRNDLVGKIPGNIGAMNTLECVDLSENRLSGEIPESMSRLTFLSYLNLSYNNLSGKIPLGTQLQSFSPSSFMRNKLYGPPLTNNSKAVVPTSNSVGEDVGNGNKVNWFVICMECGFWFGFLCVACPLILTQKCDSCIFSTLKSLRSSFLTFLNKCNLL